MRSVSVLSLVFAVGIISAQPPDRPHNDAIKAILKLSDNLDSVEVPKWAQKIVAEHDSCDISQIFGPRRYGGAGIGSLAADKPRENSIDYLVRVRWSGKQPPTKDELQKHKDDLIKMARALQAMAELAPFRMPKYKEGDKRIEEWRTTARNFKSVTRELREGIQAADPERVREANKKLMQTCNNCHVLAGV